MNAIEHDKLELYLCCRDLKNLDLLSKSDPQVKLYIKDHNEWHLLDQTEVIQDNLNPVFDTTFIINHTPEVERHLKFEVIDIDSDTAFELIGVAETTVSEILATKKHLLTLDLAINGSKPRGELVIRAEKINKKCHMVSMQFSAVDLANKDYFGKSDPFLKFYKIRVGGDQLLVHETETIENSLNPTWELFKLKDYKLAGNDYNTHFKIECWDFEANGEHQYIGGCETSLHELVEGKKEFEFISFKDKVKTGTLKIAHFSLEERKSFSDYIKSKEQLNTMIAIDFSKANSNPKNPVPLHSKGEKDLLTEYQKALQAVGQIILDEDQEKEVSVYGFGARLVTHPQIITGVYDHFSCNEEKPQVEGLSGVMDAYSHVIKNIELTGPTHFAPMINEAIKVCEEHKKNLTSVYTMLVIFTAGEIQDMEATVAALNKAAQLPLSIIIIGIGNGDFTKMKALDSDKVALEKKGGKNIRDLVQFVSFKGFGGDMDYLAQRVFAEIPDQVVDYMKLSQKNSQTFTSTGL